MHAVASAQLAVDNTLQTALDHCLGCGACESVCPAEVPYHQLLTDTRALLYETKHPLTQPRWLRLLLYVLRHRRGARALNLALYLYQRSGLQYLLRLSRLTRYRAFARFDQLLTQRVHTPLRRGNYTAQTNTPRVTLFTGCLGTSLEGDTLRACITLLQHYGYAVDVTAQQTCCGALHAHAGYATHAQQLLSQNQAYFSQTQHLITCTTGCQRQLQSLANATLSISDISDFLTQHPTPRFKPRAQRVLLHTPCTAHNLPATQQLLAQIPQLTVTVLPQRTCCGAAGSYLLQQPDMAARLGQTLLQQMQAQQPDLVLTSNLGCRLHLQQLLHQQQLAIPVWHPVQLLAQQLADGA